MSSTFFRPSYVNDGINDVVIDPIRSILGDPQDGARAPNDTFCRIP